MKRLLPAALGLSLLLTACPAPTPTKIEVATDQRVLQGKWTGDLVEPAGIRRVAGGGGKVFTLNNYDADSSIEALDTSTGKRLSRGTRAEGVDLAYRSDGKLLVVGGGLLTTHDPTTLAVLYSRPWTGTWLSEDGTVSTSVGPTDRMSTVNFQAIPTFPTTSYIQDHSSDDAWWLLGERAVRASDGLSSGGTSAHGNPCNRAIGFSPTSIESAGQAGSEYLLGWSDGVIEHRKASGELIRSFTASTGCAAVNDLYSDGQTINFVTQGREAGVINLSSGQVSRFTYTGGSQGNATLAGPEGISWYYGFGLEFQTWQGVSWQLALNKANITLDVQTSRTDNTAASVTGTGSVNGRAVQVTGTLRGSGGVVLSQLTSYPVPTLEFNLTLREGTTTVGSLNGRNDVYYLPSTAYQSQLYLNGSPTSTYYSGELRRP